MIKPIAPDWETIHDNGVQYSRIRQEYWFNGRVYDERSARHNGIVGAGAMLRETLAFSNSLKRGAAR